LPKGEGPYTARDLLFPLLKGEGLGERFRAIQDSALAPSTIRFPFPLGKGLGVRLLVSGILYPLGYKINHMGHTIKEKTKLLNRVRRVLGQVQALERAVEEEKGCSDVLHLVVAARGAMNSLMAEIIEDHIRMHVVDPDHERGSRAKGAEELIDIIQAYLR
jgi:DNA-binding FrmR family transcriptional regulator